MSSRLSYILAPVAVTGMFISIVGCSNGEASTSAEMPATTPVQQDRPVKGPSVSKSTSQTTVTGDGFKPSGSAATVAVPPRSASSAGTLLQSAGTGAGIWVTGKGSISLEPDLVLLNVGVEAMAKTVGKARAQAASSMDKIVQTAKSQGLEDRDIQTLSFNIWPRYDYTEVNVGGTRTRKQVLVGYTVNNTARIKIRDIDGVGNIIDALVDAGGDSTRINGVDFTIEDPSRFTNQLREDAVKDAISKAEHFASLTGVSVGPLVFITEGGSGTPSVRDFGDQGLRMRAAAESVSTSISGGELDLNLIVEAAFSIE